MRNPLSNIHPKIRYSALAGLLVACATFLGLPLSDGQASTLTAAVSALVGFLVPGPAEAPAPAAGGQDNGKDAS